MITVAGEALIDLVVGASGSVDGAAGRRSVQRRAHDRAARRRLPVPRQAVRRRLRRAAAVRAGARRRPDRRRQRHARPDHARDRTARRVRHRRVPVLPPANLRGGTDALRTFPPRSSTASTAIALGGLGLLIEPTASSLMALIQRAATGRDDPARPELPSGGDHRPPGVPRDGSTRSFRQVDVVKVSTDDLRAAAPRTSHGSPRRGACSSSAPRPCSSPTARRRPPDPPSPPSDRSPYRWSRWWTRSAPATRSSRVF